jgi:hypothetical protein
MSFTSVTGVRYVANLSSLGKYPTENLHLFHVIGHKYKDKLTAHPNELATTLLNDEVEPRRLKRFKPADLMKQHI